MTMTNKIRLASILALGLASFGITAGAHAGTCERGVRIESVTVNLSGSTSGSKVGVYINDGSNTRLYVAIKSSAMTVENLELLHKTALFAMAGDMPVDIFSSASGCGTTNVGGERAHNKWAGIRIVSE